jgi:hypothetical protein
MRYRCYKSKKKWQKKFIDNVFAHKKRRQDTFSKILLNNPELLNDKNNHTPKSLFKFYAPTSDNIIDIKNKRIWFSHPSTFNDPFDCHTGYDADGYEKFLLLEHIKKIGFVDNVNAESGITENDFYRICDTSTEYSFGWNSKVEEYSTAIRKISDSKNSKYQDELYKLTAQFRREVDEKIDKLRNKNIRIACFSELDSSKATYANNDFTHMAQMCSHYADNHKGFCVEYDLSSLNADSVLPLKYTYIHNKEEEFLEERIKLLTVAGLFPVIYAANRVNIPKTKLKKLKAEDDESYHDGEIEAILYKTYIVKSTKWSYEKEWRIIMDGNICQHYDNKIPFPYIKKIFLGCKMERHNIDTILEIADELNIEVALMRMDNKKFVLNTRSTDFYKWDKDLIKLQNPLYKWS